jgi:hypothetical protein
MDESVLKKYGAGMDASKIADVPCPICRWTETRLRARAVQAEAAGMTAIAYGRRWKFRANVAISVLATTALAWGYVIFHLVRHGVH